MNIEDRAILRSRNMRTPLTRLQELAPRLLQVLPDTVGGCAERLRATRQEVEETAEFALDHVANRGGRLVRRDSRLAAYDRMDGFYTVRQVDD